MVHSVTSCRTLQLTGYVFKLSMKSLNFSCLISALNIYFVQKLLRKAVKLFRDCYMNRKKLLQTPKVDEKLPSTIATGLLGSC